VNETPFICPVFEVYVCNCFILGNPRYSLCTNVSVHQVWTLEDVPLFEIHSDVSVNMLCLLQWRGQNNLLVCTSHFTEHWADVQHKLSEKILTTIH